MGSWGTFFFYLSFFFPFFFLFSPHRRGESRSGTIYVVSPPHPLPPLFFLSLRPEKNRFMRIPGAIGWYLLLPSPSFLLLLFFFPGDIVEERGRALIELPPWFFSFSFPFPTPGEVAGAGPASLFPFFFSASLTKGADLPAFSWHPPFLFLPPWRMPRSIRGHTAEGLSSPPSPFFPFLFLKEERNNQLSDQNR